MIFTAFLLGAQHERGRAEIRLLYSCERQLTTSTRIMFMWQGDGWLEQSARCGGPSLI